MRQEWVELRQRMKEHVEESNQRLFQGTYQFEGMSEYDRTAMMSPHFSAWSKATQMTSAEFVGENFAIYRGFIKASTRRG